MTGPVILVCKMEGCGRRAVYTTKLLCRSHYSLDCYRTSAKTRARVSASAKRNRGRINVAKRKLYHSDVERARAYGRKTWAKRQYGLTPDQHQKLIDEAGGKCWICQRERRLVIDHDHVTKRVRGLLCHRCNVAIGTLGDTPTMLFRAIEYLSRNIDD